MQTLFILKRADGVDHVIGKLIITDDGNFDIEDLLAEPGSQTLGIPVLKDKGENNLKLINWIVSFMPPINNNRFFQLLAATLGVDEFEPCEWLKQYKPGGRNVISFCEKIPPGCVTHCSDFSPFDFAGTTPIYEDCDDGTEMDFEDCIIPRIDYFNGDFNDYSDCDEDYYECDYDDEYEDEDCEDDEEPVPVAVGSKKQSGSLPVFPENIPPEEHVTDFKSFAEKQGQVKVDDLRTIHNTLCALTKIPIEDFASQQDMEGLVNATRLPVERLRKTTLGEFVKLNGCLINEYSSVTDYCTKYCIDIFGFISRSLRGIALQKDVFI